MGSLIHLLIYRWLSRDKHLSGGSHAVLLNPVIILVSSEKLMKNQTEKEIKSENLHLLILSISRGVFSYENIQITVLSHPCN